jgi:ribosomal protein S18 acetylase RimI-like enzyme
MLAIDPEQQAAGLGRTLLNATESYVAERGATTARMTVIQLREPLIAWYERRGYKRTGETESFPYEDQSVGNPLRADLHFVVLEKVLATKG